MPRIPEVQDAEATPAQKRLFDADRAAHGQVLNTTRIYAHRPEAIPALQGLHSALAEASNLPPALVSLARLRVAQINACPF